MIRSRTHPAARLLLVAGLLAACGGGAPELEAPHLFLITADTLRRDHLSLAGYPRATSPNLDAFAARAWNFEQAVTLLPKTAPSFASHFSGQPPGRHGVTANRLALPDELPLLAEHLQRAGYATAAFVSNPVLSPAKGFARGFDRYEQFPKEGGLEALAAACERFARERSWRRPTFVWIHLIDPHGPYQPPQELRQLFLDDALFRGELRTLPLEVEPPAGHPASHVLGGVPRYQRQGDEDRVAWYLSQYDAEIRYMDSIFGRILGLLEELGLYQGAGVLFTADHGESLGENDYFFEHGWFVDDPSVRVPLILKPPGGDWPRRFEAQVTNLDTLPSFLEMAGLQRPPGLPGRNLLEEPKTEPVLLRNASNYPQRLVALRTPRYKLVLEPDEDRAAFYDLALTAGEATDVTPLRQGIAQRLRRKLDALLAAEAGAVAPPRPVEPDAAERERLRELGYLDE